MNILSYIILGIYLMSAQPTEYDYIFVTFYVLLFLLFFYIF